MKKAVVASLGAMLILFLAGISWASLGIGIGGGYYSPNFGEINELFEEGNEAMGTHFEFKPGMMYGVELCYDVNSRLSLRAEYLSFSSTTEDSLSNIWIDLPDAPDYEVNADISYKLSAMPIFLLATYRLSTESSWRPYVGLGIGSFASKVEASIDYEQVDGPGKGTISESYEDSPIGYQILAGIAGNITGSLVLKTEARYVSAKATFSGQGIGPEGEVDCDWNGFMANLWIEYNL